MVFIIELIFGAVRYTILIIKQTIKWLTRNTLQKSSSWKYAPYSQSIKRLWSESRTPNWYKWCIFTLNLFNSTHVCIRPQSTTVNVPKLKKSFSQSCPASGNSIHVHLGLFWVCSEASLPRFDPYNSEEMSRNLSLFLKLQDFALINWSTESVLAGSQTCLPHCEPNHMTVFVAQPILLFYITLT